MPTIQFPQNIIDVITPIEAAGHKAYAVGGCIRDSVLGLTPDDWDVTTSARPDEVMAIFGEAALPTGLKHGTVTVKCGGNVEVTTFRTEGSYSDHRRPDSVSFADRIEDDLSRRDFTMNAMACGLDGEIVDPYGGRIDIENRTIRCVGDPDTRFEEDALRMFRALRFSSKLGFDIEPKTAAAIRRNAHLGRDIAPERIWTELKKLLLGACARPLRELFASGLIAHMAKVGDIDFSPVEALPRCSELRTAALCAILEKNGLCRNEEFTASLKTDKLTSKLCSSALSWAMGSDRDIKLLISSLGVDGARCAFAAAIALGEELRFESIDAVLNSGECIYISDLAITGDDLKAHGVEGREIGRKLTSLLRHVHAHPGDNTKEKLISLI